MKRGNLNEFLNLLKATRIKRTLPILAVILIPAAYSNKFPLALLALSLIIIFIYSASSIYNAHVDRDYKLPKYSFKILIFLIISAVLISLTNKIIFFATLFAIFLSYVYNKFSRFISFGDTLIAGLTHISLPLLVSSLLVNLNFSKTIQLSAIGYLLALSIGPVTDLKDIKKDKFLGYKTLVNEVKKPKNVSIIFLNLSFIIITFLYLFFGVNGISLLSLIPIFLLMIVVENRIHNSKFNSALNLMRLYIISSLTILIFFLTSNFYIILFSLSIFFIYLLILVFGIKNGKI